MSLRRSSVFTPGPLTQQAERHHHVLAAIQHLTNERGYPPTVRELGEALGTVHSAVYFDLMTLRAAGFVRWDSGVDRSITLVEV